MQKLLIATKNKGKQKELVHLLEGIPLELVTLDDIGITQDVEETGKTYQENAEKKALLYATLSSLPTLADDGGLEITALGGAPGIHSRRWLGYSATDEELIAHTKKIAQTLPDTNRQAFFKVVLSFALPSHKVWSVAGSVEGIITKEPRVRVVTGFPYRQFFFLPHINKYYQDEELTAEEQKLYNHRYSAIEQIKPILMSALHI